MISLILTIMGTIITIAMALLNWYKQAKRDGKITKDEIKDAQKAEELMPHKEVGFIAVSVGEGIKEVRRAQALSRVGVQGGH